MLLNKNLLKFPQKTLEKQEFVSIKDIREQTETKSVHFALGLNFYKLFGIFFIGSFLGVVIESIWSLITKFHFESRSGLIYGPFNPVYGFGALIATLGLNWLSKKRDLWIFIGGAILGSIFEYLCSWMQEMIFSTVSWNYGNMPFNFNGRISLLYSLFWGILALIWVKDCYPWLSSFIEKIPNKIGVYLTWVLIVFMLLNIFISAFAVERMSQRHAGVPANSPFEQFLDKHYNDKLLKKVYPNMIYIDKN